MGLIDRLELLSLVCYFWKDYPYHRLLGEFRAKQGWRIGETDGSG
jgi:hypothetical protein